MCIIDGIDKAHNIYFYLIHVHICDICMYLIKIVFCFIVPSDLRCSIVKSDLPSNSDDGCFENIIWVQDSRV